MRRPRTHRAFFFRLAWTGKSELIVQPAPSKHTTLAYLNPEVLHDGQYALVLAPAIIDNTRLELAMPQPVREDYFAKPGSQPPGLNTVTIIFSLHGTFIGLGAGLQPGLCRITLLKHGILGFSWLLRLG